MTKGPGETPALCVTAAFVLPESPFPVPASARPAQSPQTPWLRKMARRPKWTGIQTGSRHQLLPPKTQPPSIAGQYPAGPRRGPLPHDGYEPAPARFPPPPRRAAPVLQGCSRPRPPPCHHPASENTDPTPTTLAAPVRSAGQSSASHPRCSRPATAQDNSAAADHRPPPDLQRGQGAECKTRSSSIDNAPKQNGNGRVRACTHHDLNHRTEQLADQRRHRHRHSAPESHPQHAAPD